MVVWVRGFRRPDAGSTTGGAHPGLRLPGAERACMQGQQGRRAWWLRASLSLLACGCGTCVLDCLRTAHCSSGASASQHPGLSLTRVSHPAPPWVARPPHPLLSDWITNEGAPPTVGFAVPTLPFLKGRDSDGKGTRTGCVHLRPGCPSRGPRVDGPESLLPNATDVMAPSCSGCVLSHKV